VDIHREDVPGDVLVFLTGGAVVLIVCGCEGVRGWRGEGREGQSNTLHLGLRVRVQAAVECVVDIHREGRARGCARLSHRLGGLLRKTNLIVYILPLRL
jgi:hypothetical protein